MAAAPLPDLLQRTHEERGDEIVYRFANGLTICAEVFFKADRLRILPLGSPQGALMNHLLHFPEVLRGARVFEPFAGSGALGFMALRAGAAQLALLDINPRAADFQRRNAVLNGVAAERVDIVTDDIATYTPAQPYDLILANPPFVPTPDGIDGTLTSNGGADGNRFVALLLARLEALLAPDGRALIYVLNFARAGRPLVCDLLAAHVRDRPVELTPAQIRPVSLDAYARAYERCFPQAEAAVRRWRARLAEQHGDDLTLCHYVVDVGTRGGGPATIALRDNFAEKFGAAFLVPSDAPDELALARVLENVVAG